MIKINLLNSVTDRQSGASVAVERKVSSPTTRLLLMSIAVLTLFAAVVGWDFISSTRAKAFAETELVEQKKKADELHKVMKEQKELEEKIRNVDLRIEAIKKLRNSQAGPFAVLSSLRERIGMMPDIYLESIEQKGDQLTIKGSSPNESSVTQFGRSLEFSSGLFSNLSIETQRKELQIQAASADGSAPKAEVIEFTIRTSYTPEKSGENGTQDTSASNQNGQPSENAQGQPAGNQPGTAAPASEAPKVAQNKGN